MKGYVYYSPKRKRKYIRKFDYYEAQERYRNGETAPTLAREYGVTPERIYQVVSPTYKETREAYEELLKHRGRCTRCGAPKNHRAQLLGHILCKRCSADDQVTTVRPDTLKCGRCKLWLPDDAFSRSKNAKPHRRGRFARCKRCVAEVRRDARHRAFAEGRARTLG